MGACNPMNRDYKRTSLSKWINYNEGLEGTSKELFPKLPTFLQREIGSHRTLSTYLSVLNQVFKRPKSRKNPCIFKLYTNAKVKNEIAESKKSNYYRERIRILALFFKGREGEWWTSREVYEGLSPNQKKILGGMKRVSYCMRYMGFEKKEGFHITINKKWESWIQEAERKE